MARRGVQYYQCVPPPESEWEEDYAAMARAGLELVVLPVPCEGPLDAAALARQAEPAAKHGLSVAATPAPCPGAAPPAAAQFRSWAKALRGAAPGLAILLAAPCPEAPAPDADDAEWGCVAGERLAHQVADRARAFARGRTPWIVGVTAHSARQVRLQTWSSLLAGDHVLVYEAWRPELHADRDVRPGLARPDGAPSPRLGEMAWLDELLARNPRLAAARPAAPEAAVVVVRESAAFWASRSAAGNCYWEAVSAAYDALASRGAHVELAPPEGLSPYPLAYVPLAVCVSAATADALRRYVADGGQLVAEAGLARFDEKGLSARETPLHGLAEVFGARALDAPEPVAADAQPTFAGRRGQYPCFGCREPLGPTTGKAKSAFPDGAAAIVDNAYGAGAARLIGTHPSLGCAQGADKRYTQVILDSLAFARVRPRVVTSAPHVAARLLEGDGGALFLCAFNTAPAAQETRLRVSRSVGRFRRALALTAGEHVRLLNNAHRTRLGPAAGIVLRLDAAPRRRRWRPGRRAEGT